MVKLSQRPARRLGRGYSLLEVLLASGLLLVAVLAVASLFSRAVLDVRSGAERSAAAAIAQSTLEATRLPSSGMTSAALSSWAYFSRDARRWRTGQPPGPDLALWVRETVVRRYPLSAVRDGRLDRGEAEPATGEPPGVGLFGIEVRVARRIGGRPLARLERLEWARLD